MKRLFSAVAGLVLALSAGSALACPNINLRENANLGTLTGSFLYTERSYGVVAGGTVNLSRCGFSGASGFVISNPDFQFRFQNDGGYRRLEIGVVGQCDTVLLVNDATGQWHFNDDTNGLDPIVNVFGAPSGVYDVWIGTFGSSNCRASLTVETWY